jgi:hypothetical protein
MMKKEYEEMSGRMGGIKSNKGFAIAVFKIIVL